jgi:hypothetical protein
MHGLLKRLCLRFISVNKENELTIPKYIANVIFITPTPYRKSCTALFVAIVQLTYLDKLFCRIGYFFRLRETDLGARNRSRRRVESGRAGRESIECLLGIFCGISR